MMESFPAVEAPRAEENEAGLGATGMFVEKG
jgi:hypothetical protein